MAKLTRVTNKIFGENATATGDNPNIGQFGSALAGTYVGTTDVATIQNLPAWSQGWIGAVTPTQQFPALPEMTGAMKVLSYQTAYNQQMGIPEYDSATTYYTNSFCQVDGEVYISLIDENQGNNPITSLESWKKNPFGGDYVLKTGDTMSGNLTINREGTTTSLELKRRDFDYTTTTAPSTQVYIGVVSFKDVNNQVTGYIGSVFETANIITTRVKANRSINGTVRDNIFDIGVDANGKPYYNRPQIIKDYVNGTSGYRIWSNGYCEQWGTSDGKITFLKTFANTNYTINTCGVYHSDGSFVGYPVYYDKAKNGIGLNYAHAGGNASTHNDISWKVSGYLASNQY